MSRSTRLIICQIYIQRTIVYVRVCKSMFQTVPGTWRPIHEVQFLRNAAITGHSTINVGRHLHAEIGLSNASDIHYAHPLRTACIHREGDQDYRRAGFVIGPTV